jgi:fructose-1,6-bisphosphatase/inositol monophosphatase family enzyme
LISSPFNYICNKPLSLSIFPAHLKYSEIKPVFKKDDKNNITNHRPISLLTSLSKILEWIIYARLYKHINNNCILSNEQYGLRRNSSTETVSHKLPNEIL